MNPYCQELFPLPTCRGPHALRAWLAEMQGYGPPPGRTGSDPLAGYELFSSILTILFFRHRTKILLPTGWRQSTGRGGRFPFKAGDRWRCSTGSAKTPGSCP
ncbi:MAG: hypothetical protein FD153_2061 [Rhodospirillaceae bacterium]|nr:MAG: hypothetical protein FD153_2061 [Rhodospirillaceae bacterium]